MAHPQQREFISKVKEKFPNYFKNTKVLEVGSLNINGTVRDFFQDCNYIGIDVAEGSGVDIVCQGQEYNEKSETFDVACSAECFEHNPYWFETFENMIRLCKKNGLIFFTCATEGRPEHGTSRTDPQSSPLTISIGWDYYKNLTKNDFLDKMNFQKYFSTYEFSVGMENFDLYFWGIKV